jgi:DNA-directed RNA polymerase specialized sigma24 family protein
LALRRCDNSPPAGESWIVGISVRNEDRFAELRAQHQRILHHVSRRYARTPQEREDIVQEDVLDLLEALAGPKGDPGGPFLARG